MNIVVVIQARMASTRLPGKVMATVCGRALLWHMLERVRLAQEPDEIVVATTVDAVDTVIVQLCEQAGVACYRGHPQDCLDRHWQVARAHQADAVVKIPSDCPLIDPRVIDAVLARYRAAAGAYDYFSNLHPPTWPDGNDVEVMSRSALVCAAREATDPFDREHTTPFLWSQPTRFRLGNLSAADGSDLSQSLRWVVDWPEDLAVVREIIAELWPQHGAAFSASDIVQLYDRRPELARMNAAHRGYDYAAVRRATLRSAVVNSR